MLFQTILLKFAIVISFTEATIYTFFNGTNKFGEFKMKYKKIYSDIEKEQAGFINFLDNLNRVTALNENSKDNATNFVLNKYADLDPAEIEQRYSINLKPYSEVKGADKAELLRANQGVDVDKSNLYDLNDADEIYQRYQAKHARNITNERDRIAHYYRFIKTLVDKNRNVFEGNDDEELGDQADIVKEKDLFVY